MWETCLHHVTMRKSPHLYIKITMGSKRLLRNQDNARHNVNDPELKVLGSHGESKGGRRTRPVLSSSQLGCRKSAGRSGWQGQVTSIPAQWVPSSSIILCSPGGTNDLTWLENLTHSWYSQGSHVPRASTFRLYGLCEARRPDSGVVSSLLPGLPVPHIPEGVHSWCLLGCCARVAQDPSNFCAFTTEGPAVMFSQLLSNGGHSRTWRKLKH